MLSVAPTLEPIAEQYLDPVAEDFAARLTLTAYDVALRQGFKGRFTDLQSALWGEFVGLIRDCGLEVPSHPARVAV
jgi:hypothetical protein